MLSGSKYYVIISYIRVMGRFLKDYRAVIQTIVAFVDEHIHEPIPLSVIAHKAGYSSSRISAIFKKETGKNIEDYLLGRRVVEAKRLLGRTRLSITEIAFEVGFNSYTRFVVAFKKRAGVSPTEFRRAALQPDSVCEDPQPRIRERFRDDFSAPILKPCWSGDPNKWRVEEKKLSGKSNEGLELTYGDPLPENFVLRLEFQFLDNPHFNFLLHGKEKFQFHFQAVLGKYRDNTAEFQHPFLRRFRNQGIHLKPKTWYSWRFEMLEDALKVFLDDEEIYGHREAFLSRYSDHRHFTIGAWNSAMEIRNVIIHDLGHSPTVPIVRQADSLYNNNMFDAAADAYLRLLDSTTGSDKTAELHYKIGMCYLKQEKLNSAREYLNKVGPGNEPWGSPCAEALLEADRIAGDLPVYLQRCRILFERTECRDAVRTCVARALNQYSTCGHFERALIVSNALVKMEIPRTVPYDNALWSIPDLLFQLRRYDEAVLLLEHMAANADDPIVASQHLVTLADVLAYWGQFDGAEKILAKVRNISVPNYLLVRCDMVHGSILRGQQKALEAALFMEETPARCGEASPINYFALRMASHIYCQLGDLEGAERVARQAGGFASGSLSTRNDELTIRVPILFLGGRFLEAARVLVEAVDSAGTLWMRADQMICAGIMFELGGEHREAMDCWNNVTKRYPEPWCHYYARLAAALYGQAQEPTLADGEQKRKRLARVRGKEANTTALELLLEEMPFSGFHRARMWFHIGKLHEKRGALDIAKRCYVSALADDPTLNWFTWLAKIGLGG